MDPQKNDLTTVEPYRRERRVEIEPILTAIGVIALVLVVGGWNPLAHPTQDAPVELVSVKTASTNR